MKSLIAIMLGRLKMDISSCIEAYSRLSDSVFRKVAHRVTLKGNVQARFDSHALERAIKEIIKQQGLNEDALLKENMDFRCKVSVSQPLYILPIG
jgi:hypothetical protein